MPIKLLQGDSLQVLPTLAANSIDSIISDPPYGLSDHSPEDVVACLTAWLAGEPYLPDKKGFMSAAWDAWVPGPEIWRECYRVLKPGGHMLVFAGTRSLDLMTMAVRLAGFEVRDQLCWLNSQGMPHGLDISKAIDKAAGATRKVVGKKNNTYDGCTRDPAKHGNPAAQSQIGKWGLTQTPHGLPLTEPATDAAMRWQGWGSTLKPCLEPILLVRKPLDGTIVENTLTHNVSGLNIDACRVPVDLSVDDPRLGGQGTWSTASMAKNVYGEFAGDRLGSSPLGRFPSNVLWDGSDEVREVFDSFGDKASGVPGRRRKTHQTSSMGQLGMLDRDEVGYADRGSVSRFYKSCEFTEEDRRVMYCGKVSPKERGNSRHPTMKPIALMRYLARLITPKGGTLLDPFAGTGTTGLAAIEEGFSAILIEREDAYIKDCRDRLGFFLSE